MYPRMDMDQPYLPTPRYVSRTTRGKAFRTRSWRDNYDEAVRKKRARRAPVPSPPRVEVRSMDCIGPNNSSVYTLWPIANDNATLHCINAATQGTAMWNRLGRRITMKVLEMTFEFVPSTIYSSAALVQHIRFIVVYDKQANGILPQFADIWRDQTNGVADNPQSNQMSGMNRNFAGRFQVVYDKEITLPQPPSALAGMTAWPANTPFFWKDRRNLKNRVTTFRSENNPCTIADIATGSLLFGAISNTAANQGSWALFAHFRLKFLE